MHTSQFGITNTSVLVGSLLISRFWRHPARNVSGITGWGECRCRRRHNHRSEVDGHKLTDDDILGFCALLLIAGNETTTNLLGNAATVLAAHPDARAEIVADMSLLPNAIEEVLRFDGPVPTLTRTTTTDVEIRGHTISAGEKVMLLLAAANRDPRIFDDADRFDIHRVARKHIALAVVSTSAWAPIARALKPGLHSKNCSAVFRNTASQPIHCRTSTPHRFVDPRRCGCGWPADRRRLYERGCWSRGDGDRHADPGRAALVRKRHHDG
jgi:hypothetical protein